MPRYVYVLGPGVPHVWHWCKNCPDYPSKPQAVITERPTGLLCEKCKVSELDTTCRP
jgi:hypothetical protein